MEHEPLMERLKHDIRQAAGYGVELSFNDESDVALTKLVSNLFVTFPSGTGNGFIAIGNVLQAVQRLPGYVPDAAIIDLYAAQKELLIGGKVEGRAFNIKFSL